MSKLAPPPLPDVLTLGDAVSMWERSLRAADKSPRTVGSYLFGSRESGSATALSLHRLRHVGSECE